MSKIFNSKPQTRQKAPILVIENNADHWLLIRSALAQCFPEVKPRWMNHSTQTLIHLESQLLDENKLPRLILVDLCLPSREEGWALLATIKAHALFGQIPVVVLSQSEDPKDIRRAYSFGISSYLVKPLTAHQWLACFQTFRFYWWELVTLPLHSPKSSGYPA